MSRATKNPALDEAKRKGNAIANLLQQAGIVDEDGLDRAYDEMIRSSISLGAALIKLELATEEDICKAKASSLGVPYVDLAEVAIEPEALALVPERTARKHNLLPMRMTKNTLHVALSDPLDLDAIDDVAFAASRDVSFEMAPFSVIQNAIETYYQFDKSVEKMLSQALDESDISVLVKGPKDEDQATTDVNAIREEADLAPVIRLANGLMADAIRAQASDLHIEPRLRNVQVRYRLDGLLKDKVRLPKWIQAPLASRIKILANLDIAEKRLPQDGQFHIQVDNKGYDIRVSSLPSLHGEKIVARILDPESTLVELDDLGLLPAQVSALRRQINRPQGMILITGPTGSGKTTLLYALLNELQSESRNLITVENPIEYKLDGVTQVEVQQRTGLNFALGLRAVLRQDPDIIMVGEIRDQETASVAVQAAQTGHLVLSTVHTNDAVSAIDRMTDLGISPFLLSSSLNCIMSQRLVRTLCPHCGGPSQEIGFSCKYCESTGFRGRTGIYELLEIDGALREAVHDGARTEKLRKIAQKAGFKTLYECASESVKHQQTTHDEIMRVIGSGEIPEMRCQTCSRTVDASTGICSHCAAESTLCTDCQTPLEANWIVCPTCATPVPQASAAPVDTSDVVEGTPSKAKKQNLGTVVVADDDRSLVKAIVKVLTKEGYRVLGAPNGELAVELIRQEIPVAAIIDVQLPGIDGFEVCTSVRSHMTSAFVPIILMSGERTGVEDRINGLNLGALDYMIKPFDIAELVARVGAAIRKGLPLEPPEG